MTKISCLLNILKDIFRLKGAKGEDSFTNSVALELKALSVEGRLNCVWFHVPNETVVKSKEDIIRLRKKASLGMIPGAPDFVFVDKSKTIFAELKTKTGHLSENQKLFQQWSEYAGVAYYVIRSEDELKMILKKEGMLK